MSSFFICHWDVYSAYRYKYVLVFSWRSDQYISTPMDARVKTFSFNYCFHNRFYFFDRFDAWRHKISFQVINIILFLCSCQTSWCLIKPWGLLSVVSIIVISILFTSLYFYIFKNYICRVYITKIDMLFLLFGSIFLFVCLFVYLE